ncbi:ParB/RepB/Spo0J family partition protein, partial [Butyribacter intestini]|uniref:ParB/RepB/Spo0J family partition protein n=1 Tax=Butyribacter intestini TaxID=1703332 RepID=UPI003AB3638D
MTGSNILDTLNSKSISGGMNTTYARFRLQDIPIDKIYSNDKNFYPLTDIEQLANEIKLCGLMENLTVVKEHCERGDYRLVSGERRWRALTYLVEHGESKFKNVSAKITKFDNQNEEELYLIVANSYRTKDSGTKMNEVKRMQELLQNAKENGTSINGYDMQQESIRSVMSKLLGMSETKIAELTVVINHLIDEFMTMLNDGKLGISVAYKIAGMSPDMQLEFFDYCENEPKITLNVVKDFKWLKESEYENQQIPGQSSIADIKGDYDIEPENIESDVNNVIKALEHDSDAIEMETGQDDADISSQAADVKDSIKSFDALMAEKHGKCDVNIENNIEIETSETDATATDYIASMMNNPTIEQNEEKTENNCEKQEEIRHSLIEYVMIRDNISLLQYIKSRIAMYCEDCLIKLDDEQMSTMSSYLSRDINALAEQYKY